MSKSKILKVYGIPHDVYEELEAISAKKYGKSNVSLLVRDLVLAHHSNQEPNVSPTSHSEAQPENTTPEAEPSHKTRLELKLPPHIATYLTQAAKQGKMSVNRRALYILAEYVEQHPILTDNEVTALYQSNVQIGAVGRLLNQIAKRLNAGESASLTQRQISELGQIIDAHIAKVAKIIMAHRHRQTA